MSLTPEPFGAAESVPGSASDSGQDTAAIPVSEPLGAEPDRDGGAPLGTSVVDLLDPLTVRLEHLRLYARAAPGVHPCSRFGGFDSAEEMAASGETDPRLKGAVGWMSLEDLYRAEIEQARAHGVSGLTQIEGIEDIVWELSSTMPAAVAELHGHRISAEVDLSARAVEAATPNDPQSFVIERLREYGDGMLAGVELPRPAPYEFPNGMKIARRERHVIVFPDRVELAAEKLGRFAEAMPTVSWRSR